ncbi:hypothetical protein AU467_09465 [Mesorhizobium loti]|uniref:Uncharacterized protein n=1 Tax=Rhizobium loti TaxID=381 RepID=A0A101KLU5_RHILI|nr:hypothetical protein AU467_09465 [Mesorhizobium loti]
MHPAITAVLIACAFCLPLIVVGSMPMLTPFAPRDVPGPVVVTTADKGPRIVAKPGIDSACKGQNWGHESKECLVAILSRSRGGQQRSIRVIADGSSAPEPR